MNQVPIGAIVSSNGSTRRISIPGKKVMVNQLAGNVLGVVSRDYRVATIKASRGIEALAQLKIEITSRSLPLMWDEFPSSSPASAASA